MPHSWQKPKSFKHGISIVEKCFPWLDFSGMKLTHDNVEEILNTAKERDGIVKLRLNENLIGDPGAVLIGDYLANSKCIEELELSKNSISCDGLIAICKGLKQNTSLTKFTIAKNHIKNRGATVLAELIGDHKTINYVKLDNNYLTEHIIHEFIQALNKNPNIVYLHFNGPAIRKEEELSVVDALLKRNKDLKFETQKKQQEFLKTLNTAYKAKAPWRRSRLMVIGEGRTGKTALVRSLLDLPFDANLESTIVGQVNEVNVRGRGWDRPGLDDTPVDNSLSLAMSIACNEFSTDFKKQQVFNEQQAKLQAQQEEERAIAETARKEKEMVEAFNKNPAKFRKLSPGKKRELRDMMQRVKARETTKRTPSSKPFKVKQQAKKEVKLEAPVMPKRDIDISVFKSLREKRPESNEEQNEEEEFAISPEDFRKLSPEQKKVARAKLKAMRNKKKKKAKVITTLNETQLTGLLNNGEAFRNVAKQLPKLKLSVWDLGGQDVFHTVHHLFVTDYAMYVIVFDMRQFNVDEVSESVIKHIKYWCRTLNLHAPSCKVLVAGSFLDEIEIETFQNDLDINKVKAKVNNNILECLNELSADRIVKNEKENLVYFPIDNKNRHGIVNLRRTLEDEAENQQFINLEVELRWLTILDDLLDLNNQRLKNIKLQQDEVDAEAVAAMIAQVNVADLPADDPAAGGPADAPAPPIPAPAPLMGGINGPAPPLGGVNAPPVMGLHGQPVLPPQMGNMPNAANGAGTRMVDLIQNMKTKHMALFQGWVSFADIFERAKKFGVEDVSEIVNMLSLFHKLGAIFYLDSCQALMDVVTLDIAWLIDAIGKVIRDPKLHEKRLAEEQGEINKRGLQVDAAVMLSQGVASIDLLQFFWGKQENTLFLLELLQKTLLISPWDADNFLIPSLIPEDKIAENKLIEELNTAELLKVRYDFVDSNVPEGIFERIICLMLAFRNKEQPLSDIRIYKSLCKMDLQKDNTLWLSYDDNRITLAFNNHEFAQHNRQILDKMLHKIKTELGLHAFKWNILLQDPDGGNYIALDKASEAEMKPWFGSKKADLEMDLGGFLDDF